MLAATFLITHLLHDKVKLQGPCWVLFDRLPQQYFNAKYPLT